MNKYNYLLVFFLVLFLEIIAVDANSVYITEDGIRANYISQDGEEGLTRNLTYLSDEGEFQVLIIKNGVIVGFENAEGYNQNSTWWDSNWGKRKEIVISENSGEDLNNYSVLIYVPYDSNMNSDFSDLRFVNFDESVKLDYWIENKSDSGYANVWVEIQGLMASTNITVYMYYGNPSAETESSMDNVFDSYTVSDFIDSDTSANYYYMYRSNNNGVINYYSSSPGYLEAVISGWNGVQYVTVNGYNKIKYSSARLRAVGGTSTNVIFIPFMDVPNTEIRDETITAGLNVVWSNGGLYINKYISGSGTNLYVNTSNPLPDTDWHVFEFLRNGERYSLFIDGAYITSVVAADSGLYSNSSIYKFGFGTDSLSGYDTDADYFKYISSAVLEPTYNIEEEESL